MRSKYFLFIALVYLFSCQSESELPIAKSEPPPFIPRQDIELTPVERQMTAQNNTFAFNLLKTVYAAEKAHENILLSPLSATFAFAMLNNGAAGDTQKEIQQTLGFGDASRDEINAYAQKIANAMQTLDPRGVFESANSIWIKNDFPVFDAFKKVNQQFYEAEIQNVDFSKPATLNLINGWVNEKTHSKIPTILDELPGDLTRLILLNALYFKGYWTMPFDKSLTYDAVFRNSTEVEQTVPTMRTALGAYTKHDNSAAVELSFGNGAFSLVVVLPDEDATLSAVVENMDADWWNEVKDFEKFAAEAYLQGKRYIVNLEIPRFSLEYERTLNDDLKALGMLEPFDMCDANFSLISNAEDLFVSEVKQKTFAQIDEEGMEAAAVTMIGMAGSPGLNVIEDVFIDFKVNRPFLYFIKEKSTGLVFFSGVMNTIN